MSLPVPLPVLARDTILEWLRFVDRYPGAICGLCCGIPVLLILVTGAVIAIASYWSPRNRRNRRETRRVRRGAGKPVADLAARLQMPEGDLRAFVPRYTERRIPKRSGGLRVLMVPDAPTMALQRRILRLLLARLQAHPAAMGFEKGRSIVHNALPHAGQAVVISLDVVDFFTSTKASRLDLYFRRIGYDAEAAALLTRLVTYQDGLPQGAPTSPRLSNLVNYGLDARLAALATRRGTVYTRYADDITLSLQQDNPSRARGLIRAATRILNDVGYRRHTTKKLRIRRNHQQQRVTGLVVNAMPHLPRSLRRRLRAVAHHLATGKPATLTPGQLAGYQALAKMIESQTAGLSEPPGEDRPKTK